MFPRDSAGRISFFDKAVVDIINVNYYEYKVKKGIINNNIGEPINSVSEGSDRCDNAFDAHLFEWEWWDQTNPDSKLTALKDLMDFSRGLQQVTDVCYPEHYVCQDEFDGNWSNEWRTEQQRADLVDKKADRIYLYTYHKNPCDCYWGRGNNTSLDKRDFKWKVNLLRNNGYGEDNVTGETFVLPVFNAKWHCPELVTSNDVPVYYGDGNYGCNGAPGCDYDKKYSGVALNNLADHSLNKQLGYVENIFKEQYDFDPYNTNSDHSDSHIYGYSWFKSRLLRDNQFISSNGNYKLIEKVTAKVFPNPSTGGINISSEMKIDELFVFDVNGRLIYRNTSLIIGDNFIKISESGFLHLNWFMKTVALNTSEL